MEGNESSQTLELPSSPPSLPCRTVDPSRLPPIFVSLTHFTSEAAGALEERLIAHGANVTFDPTEARIVLTKVERKRRAQFDLRTQGVWTEEADVQPGVELPPSEGGVDRPSHSDATPESRTQSTASQGSTQSGDAGQPIDVPSPEDAIVSRLHTPTIKVIKAQWIDDCFSHGHFLPVDSYLVFEGVRVSPPDANTPEPPPTTPTKRKRDPPPWTQSSSPEAILARARADAQDASPRGHRDAGIRRFGDKSRPLLGAAYAAGASFPSSSTSSRPRLAPAETVPDDDSSAADADNPPPAPDWVAQKAQYACQRATPADGPNEAFISELREIRTARLLTGDEIGVRAYSTCIAAIAAYPYQLRSARELLRLPGCDAKIASLFEQFKTTGRVVGAEAARKDEGLAVLRLFYGIWGVGAATARDFAARGWRDLDDVVEFGWEGLSRVQQIGVKYYAEFEAGIARSEVEGIAGVVRAHAAKVRDGRVQSLVVGGYRRGKDESGDVDVLVSHPDVAATKGLVRDIVASLEDEGCITHTLLLALTASQRDQQTLPFRAGRDSAGSGFDTLDKALVVWQDPAWPSRAADRARDPAAKNPAPHRRVDIIVAPWRTVGCAVMGWSGGTTFQRDLRRYAKHVKGWKFDSSGVRERGTGMVVDVEGYYSSGGRDMADGGVGAVGVGQWSGRATTMEEAEKRVFAALGLEWREPWERCTG